MTVPDHRLYPDLWDTINPCIRSYIHGKDHWEQVRRHGMRIAAENLADPRVVELFALLHDCRRLSDGSDRDHGRRAAAFAIENRSILPNLEDGAFDVLLTALSGHVDGLTTDHLTVGTCWDADRLDIHRVGLVVNPAYLSTDVGQRLAVN